MRTGSGLFLLGILTLVQFRQLPSVTWMTVAGLCLLLLALRFKPLLWYCAGLLWAYAMATTLQGLAPAAGMEGRTLMADGQVTSLPEYSTYSVQFDFEISRLTALQGRTLMNPGKVRLSWYRPYPEIRAGQTLKLEIRLKQPHGYHNPDGFDYEAWLFQQRIRATGYVRRAIGMDTPAQAEMTVHSFRHRLRDTINAALDVDAGTASLVLALTIGDQSAISKDQWRTLAMTGTGHLLSISGLHIGLVALMAYFITRWLWPLSARLACRFPAPMVAAGLSLVAALIYSLMAGFTVPVQRSLIMVAAFTLPGIAGRRVASADCYAWALFLVLVMDPLAVLSTSFWLSFGSILILLVIPVVIRSKPPMLAVRWFRVQCYVFTGLILMVALWFNQLAISGFIANLVAIPWVSFITVPLLLGGTAMLYLHPDTGAWLLKLGSHTLDGLWPLLEWLEALDFLFISLAEPDTLTWVLALAGTAIVMLPSGVPARWTGPVCLLPLLLAGPQMPAAGDFEATVLDVGQGLAVVVRTHTHVLLFDTGPGYSSGFNTGWAVIVPYLRSKGIDRVDSLIVSHGDNDHAGGLKDILKNVHVDKVLTSVPGELQYNPAQPCRTGQTWLRDGVEFRLLAPAPDTRLKGNNASCVLSIRNAGGSLLIPGDIEKEGEQELLHRVGYEHLSSTVLVAPHHGSRTSSTSAFIEAVRPVYVIFSTGYLNRFRFPNQDIIQRYKYAGAAPLNTAESGAVHIQSGRTGLRVTTERDIRTRFWNFSARREER